MSRLIVKRKGLRTAFTLYSNKIKAGLSKENPEDSELSILEIQLKDKLERLTCCQAEVGKAILRSAEYFEKIYEEDLSTAEG